METEEQQLEEIRKWWKEYGRTVVLGVVLGLSGIGGWSLWRTHLNTQAETASAMYQRLLDTAASTNTSDASSTMAQTDALINQYPDSSYAALGALVGARGAYRNHDSKAAKRLLEWARTHAKVLEVPAIASLRLARILSEEGRYDEALKQLDSVSNSNFEALRNELRGDVLRAKGDSDGARSAYQEILKNEDIPQSLRSNIQSKLDDLDTRS